MSEGLANSTGMARTVSSFFHRDCGFPWLFPQQEPFLASPISPQRFHTHSHFQGPRGLPAHCRGLSRPVPQPVYELFSPQARAGSAAARSSGSGDSSGAAGGQTTLSRAAPLHLGGDEAFLHGCTGEDGSSAASCSPGLGKHTSGALRGIDEAQGNISAPSSSRQQRYQIILDFSPWVPATRTASLRALALTAAPAVAAHGLLSPSRQTLPGGISGARFTSTRCTELPCPRTAGNLRSLGASPAYRGGCTPHRTADLPGGRGRAGGRGGGFARNAAVPQGCSLAPRSRDPPPRNAADALGRAALAFARPCPGCRAGATGRGQPGPPPHPPHPPRTTCSASHRPPMRPSLALLPPCTPFPPRGAQTP